MANGINKVQLLGNLGADPELRMTSGNAVLKMRVATSETFLNRDRVRTERTEWHSVVLWGKRAEALAKFLCKGSKLYVEGTLRTSSYDDKEGIKRFRTEIVAFNIVLLGGTRPAARAADEEPPPVEVDDSDFTGTGNPAGEEEIPF